MRSCCSEGVSVPHQAQILSWMRRRNSSLTTPMSSVFTSTSSSKSKGKCNLLGDFRHVNLCCS